MSSSQSEGLLPVGCVCGHDHETERGESVSLCLECSCSDYDMRCQNCGAGGGRWRAHPISAYSCSMRCSHQIDYARTRAAA